MLNLATAATYTMPATLPPASDVPVMDNPPTDVVDSDQDAEGEEETDFYQMDQQLQNAVHRAYSGEVAAEGNINKLPEEDEKDAEGEPDIEAVLDGDNDDTEPVGAVKLPDEAAQLSDNNDDADADAEVDPEFEQRSVSEVSSSQGFEDEDWKGEHNAHDDEDAEAENGAHSNCM